MLDRKPERDARITMAMLSALEASKGLSQRALSRHLGIALGATNAHVRRCLDRGLITRASPNGTAHGYSLTSRGYLEKSQLTARHLKRSFHLYARAREDCRVALNQCAANGLRQAYICGQGILAEIAFLSDLERERPLVAGFYLPMFSDDDATDLPPTLFGKPVFSKAEQLNPAYGILFAKLSRPLQFFHRLRQEIGPQGAETHLIVPAILQDALIVPQAIARAEMADMTPVTVKTKGVV